MADEGASAASLQEEEGVLPPANRPPQGQNAPRRRTSRGSFSQKILLAGPDLWLQGTDPGLQAVCNLDEKLRGKVVQIPKHIASGVIPNHTVQWYSSGNSRLNVNQLTTEFALTPANKRLLLSAIAAYEGERTPRQRTSEISSQRSSQSQQSSAASAIIVAARQATARRAVAADQLSESDDESSSAQQSEEEEQQSEEEQQEVDEFETAYDDADAGPQVCNVAQSLSLFAGCIQPSS